MEIVGDNIYVWRNAMSPEWCENFVSLVDEKISIAEGLGGSFEEEKDAMRIAFRDNKKRKDISFVTSTYGSFAEPERDILVLLEKSLDEMREDHYKVCDSGPSRWTSCEKIVLKIQKTPPDGGFSVWHYEQGSGIGDIARRWGVWMLYLNDVEHGGKTDFPRQGVSVKPEQGSLVIWPAAYTHPHRGAPDLKEDKYVVTGWFQYWIEGESKVEREVSRV
jgi:hypothetical protein